MPVVAVILVLLAVTLGGCTTTAPREGRCVVCDEQRLVRVVPSAAAGGSVSAGRWDHPLILEEAEWEGILRSLQVRRIRRPLLGPLKRALPSRSSPMRRRDSSPVPFTKPFVRQLRETLSSSPWCGRTNRAHR